MEILMLPALTCLSTVASQAKLNNRYTNTTVTKDWVTECISDYDCRPGDYCDRNSVSCVALAGRFESASLLVPENCLFDHIQSYPRCSAFAMWNTTASNACKGRGMMVKSFAMILPCGMDVFSGVEFVCCPMKYTMFSTQPPRKATTARSLTRRDEPKTSVTQATSTERTTAKDNNGVNDKEYDHEGHKSGPNHRYSFVFYVAVGIIFVLIVGLVVEFCRQNSPDKSKAVKDNECIIKIIKSAKDLFAGKKFEKDETLGEAKKDVQKDPLSIYIAETMFI